MKLSDLLNELRRNVLRDVSDSVTKDQFGDIWTDESLVMYINEAQNRFATKTLLLRDETTPEVTEITLVEGQEVYSLDSRVRALYGARIGNLRLSRTTY